MIKYQRYTLDNGLQILYHHTPDSAISAVNLLYKVGARNEDPQRTGLAHLFEHLMFEGSVNIPKVQLADRLHELEQNKPVVILCRFGTKSSASGRLLISKGFDADLIYLLDGGIYEWATEIDTSMPSHLL